MTLEATRGAVLSKLPRLIENVERVVFGKREPVTLAIVGFLSGGHVLLEDAPGTGKTTLARAVARSLGLRFRRIQFTSDLLPADVLGVSVLDPATGEFAFKPGPIFGHVILADELNRTTPRTQSALLECMDEGRASVEGRTRQLPEPFFVIATQNPLEFEGTYALPESQLDRFQLRIRMGYPDRDAERRVLREHASAGLIEELDAVLTREEALAAIAFVEQVSMAPELVEYVLDVLEATRHGSRFLLGLSSRAGLAWQRAARAMAAVEGRDYCVPDDLKRLALPVLAHRVIPRPVRGSDGTDGRAAMTALLDELPVPE